MTINNRAHWPKVSTVTSLICYARHLLDLLYAWSVSIHVGLSLLILCALEIIDLLLVCACCCAEHLSSLSMKAVTLGALKNNQDLSASKKRKQSEICNSECAREPLLMRIFIAEISRSTLQENSKAAKPVRDYLSNPTPDSKPILWLALHATHILASTWRKRCVYMLDISKDNFVYERMIISDSKSGFAHAFR